MFTKENATSTVYYDFIVKCFQTASDATKLVDSINQGYMLTDSVDSSSRTNNSVYSSIMGHEPTRADTYMRIDSIIPPKASMIFQVDEFVMYGPGTVVTSSQSSQQTATPVIPASPLPQPTAQKDAKNDFSRGTYVLYFWLPQCPPCGPMMTKINAIEAQYKGANVTVVKINADENASSKDISRTYIVKGVPTIIFIHNEKIVDRFYPRDDVDLDTLLNAVEKARNSP